MPSVKNRHECSVYDPFSKTKYFCFIFLFDSLRNIVWTVSLSFSLSLSLSLSLYIYIYIYIYSGQSPRIICILDVPSNPKHKVDHFHALTPMSCDASCINAMQVSLNVISCYMYATCHMQHINHTLHVKCHV